MTQTYVNQVFQPTGNPVVSGDGICRAFGKGSVPITLSDPVNANGGAPNIGTPNSPMPSANFTPTNSPSTNNSIPQWLQALIDMLSSNQQGSSPSTNSTPGTSTLATIPGPPGTGSPGTSTLTTSTGLPGTDATAATGTTGTDTTGNGTSTLTASPGLSA